MQFRIDELKRSSENVYDRTRFFREYLKIIFLRPAPLRRQKLSGPPPTQWLRRTSLAHRSALSVSLFSQSIVLLSQQLCSELPTFFGSLLLSGYSKLHVPH